jgi:hypothetical protein
MPEDPAAENAKPLPDPCAASGKAETPIWRERREVLLSGFNWFSFWTERPLAQIQSIGRKHPQFQSGSAGIPQKL